MLVIAFDGVLFDTLDERARAVFEALRSDVAVLEFEKVRATVTGCSIVESVRALAIETSAAGAPNSALDETAVDLACLRAERAFAAAVTHGFSLNMQARNLLQRAAAVTRIVIRADSKRREVESLLQLAGLDGSVSMIRCSDDQRSATTSLSNANSITRSYDLIAGKLANNAGLLGEAGTIGIALEIGANAQAVARKWGFETPPDLTSVRFPGVDQR